MEIIIKDLTVKYKPKKEVTIALDSLSIKINSGDFFVILGESGSGKTTLLNCLSGLNFNYEGEIIFDDTNILEKLTSELNIGFVTQDFRLYPNLTIFENIAFPLKNAHVPIDEIRRRVNEIANTLDIHHLLTRKPKFLSGGQQQKVAIARALVKNPTVCLFDEPFSNLDEHVRISYSRMLKDLHQKYSSTFVYVTHNVKEAFILSDTIAILKEGKLIQSGTPMEIYSKPKDDYVRYLIKDLNFDFGRLD